MELSYCGIFLIGVTDFLIYSASGLIVGEIIFDPFLSGEGDLIGNSDGRARNAPSMFLLIYI